jgi:hypothetical protein
VVFPLEEIVLLVVCASLAGAEAEGVTACKTVGKGHGRLETRRHALTGNIDWLLSSRRHPAELSFPGLAMIGMLESTLERGPTVSRERRDRLCSKMRTTRARTSLKVRRKRAAWSRNDLAEILMGVS